MVGCIINRIGQFEFKQKKKKKTFLLGIWFFIANLFRQHLFFIIFCGLLSTFPLYCALWISFRNMCISWMCELIKRRNFFEKRFAKSKQKIEFLTAFKASQYIELYGIFSLHFSFPDRKSNFAVKESGGTSECIYTLCR